MPSDDMLQAIRPAATRSAAETAANAAEDQAIAAACAAGDPAVFERLYIAQGKRMKSIAFNHLGNTGDAEDAIQETFLKIHRAATTYTGQAPFATWMVRILINTCYDMLRKRRRRTDDAPIEGELLERSEANVDDAKRITLRKLINSLPEQRRTVFTLFEIEGLSHAEIAGILGITEGNSKWILFSTKKQLQQLWKTR